MPNPQNPYETPVFSPEQDARGKLVGDFAQRLMQRKISEPSPTPGVDYLYPPPTPEDRVFDDLRQQGMGEMEAADYVSNMDPQGAQSWFDPPAQPDNYQTRVLKDMIYAKGIPESEALAMVEQTPEDQLYGWFGELKDTGVIQPPNSDLPVVNQALAQRRKSGSQQAHALAQRLAKEQQARALQEALARAKSDSDTTTVVDDSLRAPR